MNELSTGELEGRLVGQREVLAVMLAHLMRTGGTEFERLVEAQLGIGDHQEDPGAVPEEAFAVEAAAALERRQVIERARAIAAGPSG
jgi:hypothetical protein